MVSSIRHGAGLLGGYLINENSSIIVGNNVWISSGCKVLKGVEVKEMCIIAANTVLTKSFGISNCIIGGTPNKVIKENVNWER